MEEARAKGATLLLDAGNALWRPNTGPDADSKRRAAFILTAMAKLGTQAMAAGAKDLVAGADWLKEEAARAKVPVLSANLVDGAGKPIFPASTTLEVAGKRVAVIGASPASRFGEAKGLPIAAAVLAEAKKLRAKADLVVVLAAVPYADSLQLSHEAGDQVDLILQTHEGRGTGMLQRGQGNFVAPSGERGRQLGRLAIELGGKGPLIDAGQLKRDEESLAYLDKQIDRLKARIAATKDKEGKAALSTTLGQFNERRRQLALQVDRSRQASGRKLALDWTVLGPEFPEDAALAAEVKKIEPVPPAH